MFISIEGPDGVGKSTIINKLKEIKPEALIIREPGTTIIGEKIRKILLTDPYKLQNVSEVLLFATSFCETTANIIIPALKKEQFVIADRWFYSTIAYQCHASTSNKNSFIFNKILNELINNGNIITPKLNFILMAPWETIQKRISSREKEEDKIESRELEFKKKVYDYYENHCKGFYIDADNDPTYIACQILIKIYSLKNQNQSIT